MSTLKEVAERAGVSRRTVDRVLNQRGTVRPETERRVREALRELDYRPDEAGQALAAKKRRICLGFCSVKGRRSVIHEAIRRGAREKTAQLEKRGISVKFYTIDRDTPPSAEEIEAQAAEFDCDGLAALPSREPAVRRLLELARERKIPVAFYNLDDQQQERLCYVGCDYVKSGRLAAGLVSLGMSGSGGCAGVFTVGNGKQALELPNYRERLAGFREELSRCAPDVVVGGEYLLTGDVFDCYEAIKRAFAEHPGMETAYLVNPGDYSVCEAMRKAAGMRRFRLITNDLTEESEKLLRAGVISAAISQEPELQGSLPLELLAQYLVYGRLPEREIWNTQLRVYLPQSL